MRSSTVCSFCFWAISDWVTSATFSFSPSSFSEAQKNFGRERDSCRGEKKGRCKSTLCGISISEKGQLGFFTEELLQDLSIVEVFSQVLNDDSLSDEDVVDPVDQHLQRQN